MPASPSSSAQAAREAVAARLRELRLDAGLTGTELASRCGWHHAKTSRIENARTAPSVGDVRRWCQACGAGDEAAELVTRSRHAESLYVEWRRKLRAGLRQLQHSYVPLFKATQVFRVYSPTDVPGLLQTEGYVRGMLTRIAAFHGVPNDVEEAVAARLERSRVIHEPGHRFVFVVEESVLRYQIADTEAMAAQLGYLLTAGALPSVSLGVVPESLRERTVLPMETFHLYDAALVSVELLSAEVNITQPGEIALYLKAFERLRSLAVYGGEARALIVNAIEALG